MGDARHVVAAPDKFKGTLTAAEAAAHIAAGLRAARPGLVVRQVPVADGGDGTVAAAVAAGYQPVRCTVRGRPANRSTPSSPGRTAPRSSRPRRLAV
jgi:glycerate 2-kinase